MEAVMKTKDSFDGTGDVKIFVSKIELKCALKGYTGEKCAMALASTLEGSAFNVYLRMSTDDRKDVEKIKKELLSEYELGNMDREKAVVELSSRSRLQNEPAKTYAFKLEELVKLAYPTFSDNAKGLIVKDAYVKGLHPDLQLQLKSLEKFSTTDVKGLIADTTRLEIAGIKSAISVRPRSSINLIKDNETIEMASSVKLDELSIQKISDVVVEKDLPHN